MKKFVSGLIFAIMLMASCVTFFACSEQNPLIGTWKADFFTIDDVQYTSSSDMPFTFDFDSFYMKFKADNMGESNISDFVWELNENQLEFVFLTEEGERREESKAFAVFADNQIIVELTDMKNTFMYMKKV